MDNLISCKRCGGNACYEQTLQDNLKTWLCMGCGFTTSDLMAEGSKTVQDLIDTSPELYKDLLYKDDSNFIWAPSTVSLPGKGMVFIDGTSKNDWKWSAALAIELTEEEKTSGKYPVGQTHQVDMNSIRKFDQKEFMDALETIGFFTV